MLNAYVTCIRQVATLLGYGEPQVLEIFKNKLPTRLYQVLFPIEDLRLAVETANRMLTKETIDRQIAGQSPLTPFINIRDGYNSKKVVTFDMQDRLDNKIDKLTSMMSKLTTQGNNHNKNHLNQKFIKEKGEDKQEMCGLAINIATFEHMLKRVDFDAIVDHLALTHIINSKAELPTTRIEIIRNIKFLLI